MLDFDRSGASLPGDNEFQKNKTKELLSQRSKKPLWGGHSFRSLSCSELANATSSHGTTVSAIERLVSDGVFSRPDEQYADLGDDFFMTPNPKCKQNLLDIVNCAYVVEEMLYQDIDIIAAGIDYAELNSDEPGVVILFGKEVLKKTLNPTFYSGGDNLNASVEGSQGYELVIKGAPSVKAINGIYPVDALAARALNEILS